MLKNGYWDSKSIHNNFIHTYTSVTVYTCTCIPIYNTCRYIYICMFIHTHAYTHIRTHIQHIHVHTRKHAWNDSAAATARGADPDAGSSARLFHSTQSTNKEQLNPAAAHHTITTARRPDNTRSFALVRSWFTLFMARPSCRPRRRSSETGSHFCHFSLVFQNSLAGQSAVLSVSTTPVRFRQKLQKSRTRNLYSSTQSFEQSYKTISYKVYWYCFYYFERNSLVALLEALCAQM